MARKCGRNCFHMWVNFFHCRSHSLLNTFGYKTMSQVFVKCVCFFFLWAVEVRDSKSLALPVKKYSNSQTSWWHITCDEIMTDYNTKAVNVVAYQKRDNNSDTAGKGCKQNSTTEKQISYFKGSALFDPFCCPESIVIYCDRQFLFSQRTRQVEPSLLLLDIFSKSSTLPLQNWQHTAYWSFSWSFSPATVDFRKSPSSNNFYMTWDLWLRLLHSLGGFAA